MWIFSGKKNIRRSNHEDHLKTMMSVNMETHKESPLSVRKMKKIMRIKKKIMRIKKKIMRINSTLPAVSTQHNQYSETDFYEVTTTVSPDMDGWKNSPAWTYWKPWKGPPTIHPGPDILSNGIATPRRK